MGRDRSSEADEPPLVTDAQEVARIEAENTLRQFDAAMDELSKWINDPQYRLKPSTILRLNRIALERLSKYAGVFRPSDVKIRGSSHSPVSAPDVPALVEDFCEYVNANWHEKNAIHLSAYALWRINWIHPFVDGNGRTARVISYLILCAKLGHRLPGTKTIPEQIAANKQPYYKALESADSALSGGDIDVSDLENLMDAHLAAQLVEVHNRAIGSGDDARAAIAEYPPKSPLPVAHRKESSDLRRIVRHIESHPVVYGFIGLLVVSVIGILFAR